MKKNTGIFITGTALAAMMALSMAACGSTGNTSTGSSTAVESVSEGETITVQDYSWEELIEKNKGEKMLAMFDEDGKYLTFLGNKFSDIKVNNEDDARNALENIHTLLGLDDVSLTYYRTDVSPVTGNKYYTFYQTGEGNVNGETINARFYNSLVKVIVDKEGNAIGVSASLEHNADLQSTSAEFLTKDEVNQIEKNTVGEDREVYADATELVYWNDQGTVGEFTKGKVIPAYMVFTDSDPDDESNTDNKPYEVHIISAEENEDGDVREIQSYYTDSLKSEDTMDKYTSSLFFDNMEDVGNYTYTVNMDWVKEAYPEYDGEMSRQVTVPVMRDKTTGLYYLGSKEKQITLTNYYDFAVDEKNEVNAYVSENPDDLNSWHFNKMSNEQNGVKEYFNDPNYVLAAFEVFSDVQAEFRNRYKLNSVDSTNIPLLLEVYCTSDDEYPEEVSDFDYNAYNNGQKKDWATMAVSPALAECLNHSAMSHEYTHGINGQLTTTKYLNEQGAIMESYADIIGVQMAMVSGYHDNSADWELAGKYSEKMRSMSDPTELEQPKYKDGTYYTNPVGDTLEYDMDHGGVHQNSGVLNYLAYCMVNGSDEIKNPATLSVDDNLDMWFETMYMMNTNSEYYNVAEYVRFAAKCMKLPEEQQNYLYELMKKSGIAYGDDYQYTKDVSEDSRNLVFSVEMENQEDADQLDVGVTMWNEENDNTIQAGEVDAGETIEFKVKEGDKYRPQLVFGDEETEETSNELVLSNDLKDKYHIVLEHAKCNVGDEYQLVGDGKTIFHATNNDAYDFLDTDAEGHNVFRCQEEGTYILTAYDEENDVYKVYLIEVA